MNQTIVRALLAALVLLAVVPRAAGQPRPPIQFIANEGSVLSPGQPTINFVGSGVNATVDEPNKRVNVTITGGGGGGLDGLTCTAPVSCGPSLTDVTIAHAASGISAATYGSASSVPVCAYNSTGHATSCTSTSIAIAASQVTSGTLPVARGGTNATSGGSLGSVACWGSGNAYAFTAGPSSTHDLLHGNPSGTGVATWGPVALATEVSGTLPYANLPGPINYRPYFDIRDFGALANADIAPAVQAAFDAACDAGGGFVVVPSRDKDGAEVIWLWQSAVVVNCQPGGIGPPTQLGLVGPGAILVSAQPGSPYTVLTVQQVLQTRDLRWYGSIDTAHPSTGMNPISALIRDVGGINSSDNQYNGLKLDRPVGTYALQPENAVLVSTAIRSERDQFSAIAGSQQSVIRAADWIELVVRDFWIRDFYIYNGVTMSPTDGGEYPYASIVAIRPAAGSEQNHFAAQSVIIENGRIDEGSGGLGEQVIVWRGFGETTEKAQFVTIRNVSSMVPPTSGSAAIRIDGVHKASIEDWFVFAGSGGGIALYADTVDELTIRRTFTCTACNPAWPANDKVLITSGVGLVRAEDSHLNLSTNNGALQTVISKAGVPINPLAYTTLGRPSASATRPGAVIWNSTTSRLNASDGSSTWGDIPFGVIGTDIQPYNAFLAAAAGLGTNGLVARTSSSTAAARSVACGSSTCSVANADGAAGNPTVTVAATTINGTPCTPGGSCSPTATATNALTLGTGLTGSSYNGSTPVTATVSYGTSSTTACRGDDVRLLPTPTGAGKICYDTGAAYSCIAAGSSGQCLKSGGAGAPTWGSCSAGGSDATSIQGVAVSASAPSDTNVLCYSSGANQWQPCASAVPTPGSAGNLQVSNGSAWVSVAMSGDATIAGSGALTLAASGVSAATYGSATQVPVCAVDAKGRATSCTNTSIAIAASQVTSGQLAAARGGTGLDTSASTGVPRVSAGVWSILAALTAALGGTGIDTSGSTGVPSISAGTWSVAARLSAALGGTGLDTSGSTGVATASAGVWSFLSQLSVALGGTGRATLTDHGVLVGAGTAAITQLAAAAAGTVLVGQGAASDPAFTATPTFGVAGTTLGSVALAGNTSGAVTIKPQAAAGTYNFNLPTSAGSSGQPLLSGGGVASPQTYGTLGPTYGGTGQDLSACTGVPTFASGTAACSSLVPIARGGTNASAVGSAGSIPYSSGGTSYGFSNAYTSGYVWTSGGTGAPVAVQSVPVANGGTGLTTLTAHALYAGNGTGAPAAIGPDASTTKALFAAGAAADPAFRALAVGDLPAVSFPQFVEFTAAVCQNATASLAFSTPTSNAAAAICITGTNTQLGAAQFSATGQSVQGRFMLPDDWATGSGNDLVFRWRDVGTTGNTVWKLETKCASDSGAVVPDSWNTGQTVSTAAQGTTLFTNTATISTITTTGCSAGNLMLWRVSLDSSSTSTGNHDLFSVRFKVKRTVTLQ